MQLHPLRLWALAVTVLIVASTTVHAQPMPAGSEFQVNTYTTDYQYDPAVAVNDSGTFVVVWSSYEQDGDAFYYAVIGRRYNADGTPASGEFQVNTYTTDNQYFSEVAMNDAGAFVVVWESYDQDGSNLSVQGQLYNSDGTLSGSEFQVNSFTTGYQGSPAVAMDSGGAFVVVWESYDQDGNLDAVEMRRYNSEGTPITGEIQVNTYTTDDQDDPHVAIADNGTFVIVWESTGQDGDDTGVRGQRFNSDGTTAGGEFQVNTFTTGPQNQPRVAIDADGDFVVVWISVGQDGDYESVHGQRFNSDGTEAGGEFQVNSYTTGYQDSAAVAMRPSGTFVVVWESGDGQDGSYDSSQGQRYASDGTLVGGEFQINTYTTDDQDDPVVGVSDLGFVVIWEGYAQDGDFESIQGQRYSGPLPVDLQKFSVD